MFLPHETREVEIFPRGHVLTKCITFQAGQILNKLRLQAETQVVSGVTNTMKILVTNKSNFYVKLYSNTKADNTIAKVRHLQ